MKTSSARFAICILIAGWAAPAKAFDPVDWGEIYWDGSAYAVMNNNVDLVLTAGPDFWGSVIVGSNQARGAMEFSLPQGSGYGIYILSLGRGPSAGNNMEITNIYGYVADGVLTPSDHSNTSNLIATIERPPVSDISYVDVSNFVNAHLGNPFIGFLFVAATHNTYDTFGPPFGNPQDPSRSGLSFTPLPTPEPTSAILSLMAILPFMGRRKKRAV